MQNISSQIISKTHHPLLILLDSGADINIFRDLSYFVSTVERTSRVQGLGPTVTSFISGIVEAQTSTIDGEPILIRFHAIYIPPSAKEAVNVFGIKQVVAENNAGCFCIGRNCPGKSSPGQSTFILESIDGEAHQLKTDVSTGLTSLIITKPSSNHNLKVIDISHQLSAAKTCPSQQQQVNFNISNQSNADELKANSSSSQRWSVWQRPTPIEINQIFTASLLDVEKEEISQNTPETGSLNPSTKNHKSQNEDELNSLARDEAMLIHQQFNHFHWQKILAAFNNNSMSFGTKKLSNRVINQLKILTCKECEITRRETTQHPKSTSKQRSIYPFQQISVDVLMSPCIYKKAHVLSLLEMMQFIPGKGNFAYKRTLKPVIIADDYIATYGLEAPFAIVFVCNCTRWKTVVPLQHLSEDDFIAAFTIFKEEALMMMAKYQRNPKAQEDFTAFNLDPEGIKTSFWLPEAKRIQEILTDQQTGIYKSEKFRNAIKNFWNDDNSTTKTSEVGYSHTILQFVPRGIHAHNGIAERAIRTLKTKAMTSLFTAFGHLDDQQGREHKFYEFWAMAILHATYQSNVMPINVDGKVEQSPYSRLTNKSFEAKHMYPFYATGFYPPSNQQSQNFSKRKFLAEREESQRQTILTEKGISLKHQKQQQDLRKQKAAKDDPLKDRTEVKFFWMDLKGQFPQPVFFNIQQIGRASCRERV